MERNPKKQSQFGLKAEFGVHEAGIEEADSFINAAYSFLMKDKKRCSKILTFYCRKPRSGDLQYMAIFDGLSSRSAGYEMRSHIIKLATGKEYFLTDEGFELL